MPRKSVVRLSDHPDMTLDVYRGRKTKNQQQQQVTNYVHLVKFFGCLVLLTAEAILACHAGIVWLGQLAVPI